MAELVGEFGAAFCDLLCDDHSMDDHSMENYFDCLILMYFHSRIIQTFVI